MVQQAIERVALKRHQPLESLVHGTRTWNGSGKVVGKGMVETNTSLAAYSPTFAGFIDDVVRSGC
jgi:hypothetical protein